MSKLPLFLCPHLLLLICILNLFSCTEDPKPTPTQSYKTDGENGVLICNEGNFTYGNASLSYYYPDKKSIDNQIFYNANGFPLGDIVQSATQIGDELYVAVNNSGKIEVIHAETFKHIVTIGGLTSPRYILPLRDSLALVTDLYAPQIAIINTKRKALEGNIPVGKGTEQMVDIGQHIWVTSWSSNNKIFIIDKNSLQVTDTLTVGKQPNSIVADAQNYVWVLCDGSYQGSDYGVEKGSLWKFDAKDFSVRQKFLMPDETSSPSSLTSNAGKDTLYFLNKNVYRMPINSTTLPPTPFLIPSEQQLFYGLGISPDGDIYLSDAKDYLQKGSVLRFNPQGEQIDTFDADIIPGAFTFISHSN